MDRFICIHGHFYQPPRENPWLEAIELQDSAYPYHDWNARITAECYGPNATSRILDGDGKIAQIVNNYSKISFNFGPTLLVWMQDHAPEVYEAILDADRQSRRRFSGHGSALAQAYNHVILPLANRRDKYTQIVWGLRDFEHRFGRKPEGMWLPETAVDLESLSILAEAGIKFTILAPYQARRVRPIGGRSWRNVSGGRIDPSMAYVQRLPSGRSINLFFYDGPISQAVAFERLLTKGEYLAERLLNAFSDERSRPQLVHIATDGETYGHHHRHGDMALAYALQHIESNQLARLTNYGEFLERHPPSHQVDIFENTAWSCMHGVGRWERDCGCNSGGHAAWNQAWREPLRHALDWLRDTLAPLYEDHAKTLLKEPWAARHDYIDIVLDRAPERLDCFLSKHATRRLAPAEQSKVLKLLELQRHAMLMYTSCGWFFDELSGIETVQILQYADRAVQLAQELFGDAIEARFCDLLKEARSNIPEHRDGSHIYEKFVKPATVTWERIGAHYAVSSLFEDYASPTRIYCYNAALEDDQRFIAGNTRLAVGRATLTSMITQESARLTFGVLHFGDHNVNGGVREFTGEEAYQPLVQELAEAFKQAEFPEIIRLMDRHFGESNYSLRSLFRDEQRKIVPLILESVLEQAEGAYRQIYESRAPLMRFLTDLRIPLPRAFQAAAEFVLNADFRRAFETEDIDAEHIGVLMTRAREEGLRLDIPTLEYAFRQTLERLVEQFYSMPSDLSLLRKIDAATDLVKTLPFETEMSKVQNVCYALWRKMSPELRSKAAGGDPSAQDWIDCFASLGDHLAIRLADTP